MTIAQRDFHPPRSLPARGALVALVALALCACSQGERAPVKDYSPQGAARLGIIAPPAAAPGGSGEPSQQAGAAAAKRAAGQPNRPAAASHAGNGQG